jgi:hypothetical protein
MVGSSNISTPDFIVAQWNSSTGGGSTGTVDMWGNTWIGVGNEMIIANGGMLKSGVPSLSTGQVTLHDSAQIVIWGGGQSNVGIWQYSQASLDLFDDSNVTKNSGSFVVGDDWYDPDGLGIVTSVGNVTVNDNATMALPHIVLGNLEYGIGRMTLNQNGQVTNTGNLILGIYGGRGNLILNDNSLFTHSVGAVINVGDNVSGGPTGPAGMGTVTINGNAKFTNQDPQAIRIGLNGGTGRWIQNGGTLNPAPIMLGSSNALHHLSAGYGRAYVELNGGVFQATFMRTGTSNPWEGPNTAEVTFNGGTLMAMADGNDFISDAGNAKNFHLYVKDGGAVIDSNGYRIKINYPIESIATPPNPVSLGGLLKLGEGWLTLNDGNMAVEPQGYDFSGTGPLDVNKGTLIVKREYSLATTLIHIAPNPGALGNRLDLDGWGRNIPVVPQAGVILDVGAVLGVALTPNGPGDPVNTITANPGTLLAPGPWFVEVGAQGAELPAAPALMAPAVYTIISDPMSPTPGPGVITRQIMRPYLVQAAAINPGTGMDVTIVPTGIPAETLTWNHPAAPNNRWELLDPTFNWLNSTGGADQFFELDTVNFGPVVMSPEPIDVIGRVHATAINFAGAAPGVDVYILQNSANPLDAPGRIVGDGTSWMQTSCDVQVDVNLNITGDITINGCKLSMGPNSGVNDLPGKVMLTTVGGTPAWLEQMGDAELRLSGFINDDGITGVQKYGTGKLVLANAIVGPAGSGGNAYFGPTVMNDGTLEVASLANYGQECSIGPGTGASADLQLNNGMFHYTGRAVVIDRGYQMGSGTVIMRLDNSVTFTGLITSLGGGSFCKDEDAPGDLIYAYPVAYDGTPATTNVLGDTFNAWAGKVIFQGPTGIQTRYETPVGFSVSRDGGNTTLIVTDDVQIVSSGWMGFAHNTGGIANVTLGTPGGTDNVALSCQQWFNLGVWSGCNGTMNMYAYSSVNANATNNGWSAVGADGTGWLEMWDNSTFTIIGEFDIGVWGTGLGTLKLHNNAVFIGDWGWIGGWDGGRSTIELYDNSMLSMLQWANIGEANCIANVTLNQSAQLTTTTGLDIGWGTNSLANVVANNNSAISCTNAQLRLGVAGTATGNLTMNHNSTLAIAAWGELGNAHGVGNMTLNGNSVSTFGDMLTVGDYGGTGYVNVNGSAQLTDNDGMELGLNWGNDMTDLGKGYVTVNGGQVTVNTVGTRGPTGVEFPKDLIIGSVGGQGEWTQNGGKTTATTVVLGEWDWYPWDDPASGGGGQSPGIGVLNLNGGAFECAGISTLSSVTINPPGITTGTVNFNGGTLRATANNNDFVTNDSASSTMTLNVQAGGAVIDTQAFTVKITKDLVHDAMGPAVDGGLTQLGPSGTLKLSGNLTYTGPTSFEGTLKISGDPALHAIKSTGSGTGELIVGDIAYPATVLSATRVGVKTLTVTAGSKLTIEPHADGLPGAGAGFTPVPEPSTFVLLALAGLGVLLAAWRRR